MSGRFTCLKGLALRMRPEHVWTIRMMLLHDGPVLRQSNTLGDVDKWTCLDPNDSPPQRDWQSNVCEPTVIQTRGRHCSRCIRGCVGGLNTRRRRSLELQPLHTGMRRRSALAFSMSTLETVTPESSAVEDVIPSEVFSMSRRRARGPVWAAVGHCCKRNSPLDRVVGLKTRRKSRSAAGGVRLYVNDMRLYVCLLC